MEDSVTIFVLTCGLGSAATDTAMIPVFLPAFSETKATSRELLSPDDVAEIIVWLLSDEARLINGVNLPIGFRE